MYKEIIYALYKGEEPKLVKAEKVFSEEEVVAMIKSFIIDKALQHPEIPIEELEKGFGNAFKTGLTVLGLIHGAHQIGSMDTSSPAPQERQERSISKPKTSMPFSETSYGGKQVQKFLGTVGNLPSSTIKGMDSETHDDHLSSLINRYKGMDDVDVDQHLEKFPENRRTLEQHHAGNIFREHGGDFKGMTNTWNKKQEVKPDNQIDQNNSDQYRNISSD